MKKNSIYKQHITTKLNFHDYKFHLEIFEFSETSDQFSKKYKIVWNFWDLGNFGALNVNIQNEVTNSASIHAGPYVSTNDINMIDPTKLLRTWRMKRERRSKQQRNKYSTWARRRRTELGNSRVLLLSLYSEFITHAVTLTAHSGSLATSTRPTECHCQDLIQQTAAA